ncbi:MAG: FAD:protein FMN transferase, partial [Myxococcales bacterium]|nr:FAD:protein FMN transferase [Myxococcales bacterium]
MVSLLTLLACRSNTEPQGQGASGGDEQPRRADRQEEQIAAPVRDDGTIFADAEMMGTRVSINLWIGGGDAVKATKAINDAMFEMARIESIASEWRADTDLSRLNAHAGEGPQKVAPELVEILARAREVSADTGGLFDVSFYGVGQLWSFKPGAQPPGREAIAERLPLVDWRGIELDAAGRRGRLARSGMKLGLGAIAKGYAVDRASALLRARDFPHHIVEGGGDTYVSGTKGGASWMVGIQDPDSSGGGTVGALPVRS